MSGDAGDGEVVQVRTGGVPDPKPTVGVSLIGTCDGEPTDVQVLGGGGGTVPTEREKTVGVAHALRDLGDHSRLGGTTRGHSVGGPGDAGVSHGPPPVVDPRSVSTGEIPEADQLQDRIRVRVRVRVRVRSNDDGCGLDEPNARVRHHLPFLCFFTARTWTR